MTETIVSKQVSQILPSVPFSRSSPAQTHGIGGEPTDLSFLLANEHFALKILFWQLSVLLPHNNVFNVFKKQWVHLKSTGRS